MRFVELALETIENAFKTSLTIVTYSDRQALCGSEIDSFISS